MVTSHPIFRTERRRNGAQKGEFLVSSISVWEISRWVLRGRIALGLQLSSCIAAVESAPSVRFIPIDNAVVMASEQLIRDYPHVQIIW